MRVIHPRRESVRELVEELHLADDRPVADQASIGVACVMVRILAELDAARRRKRDALLRGERIAEARA